jgi:hypothetical protein
MTSQFTHVDLQRSLHEIEVPAGTVLYDTILREETNDDASVRLLALFVALHDIQTCSAFHTKKQCRGKFLKEEETAAEHDGVVVWCLYLRKRF